MYDMYTNKANQKAEAKLLILLLFSKITSLH